MAKGFDEETKGRDHDYYVYEHDGKTEAIYTKLSRSPAYKSIDDKVLAKISRQLKLPRKDFNRLVDCTMSKEDYKKRLLALGIIGEQPT